ncbi:ABC transporter ATP-binding protein [Prosthecodimorpha hirschii]|uniref:ABC transporter ATP-binding protein n=1 Tax=Prosthecodimorpha hirschii TaxID=665126 RepID=UPI0015E45380|nr:ATP-binding cassette domain-containing protein [Prosthecomicrobium hirschii]
MSAPAVDCRGISVRFMSERRTVTALEDVSFSVEPGGFTSLLGPSGCGKSTLLRVVADLIAPSEGHISVLGTSPAEARRGRSLGFVFQDAALLPWRTVEDNVRLMLPPARRGTDLGPLFAELDLAEARTRFPQELSLGMERRVALARALAVEPDLLVLDEPLVSLDDMTAARLRRLIAAAAAVRGVTVLMVTHNVREALEMADRLILLAPRPTRVIGEERLDRPRGDRPAVWIDSIRADLARRYPGTISED